MGKFIPICINIVKKNLTKAGHNSGKRVKNLGSFSLAREKTCSAKSINNINHTGSESICPIKLANCV